MLKTTSMLLLDTQVVQRSEEFQMQSGKEPSNDLCRNFECQPVMPECLVFLFSEFLLILQLLKFIRDNGFTMVINSNSESHACNFPKPHFNHMIKPRIKYM